ncbi:MAG TPA: helix-turn-helix domain-containing protein [Candidatus Mediterraneibacter ornithocaccae]|uniref:helix-turn-helix transcriptional regulator n=1 Tax=Mediterraneibacter glycyrrhizinilyticus TaxID=342942 RepID=UPI000B3AE618|nr:helix-turn-helix transcriptional regulator [Mediterraneibacter glycyrrhizinilyticus]MDN0045056.1 helix-turn-helix transcriptional regulator [Mediterraneibacter glycyrrhizinilyticus]MDN0061892.1 helix-turn-helix transcriptional regulator [Mediterraneibacter glycyrrhizinilyticus]OUO27133.1 transcriptional regulator [Lachnoclostridium sp. An298]HJA18540.1 helix-turn-helix domain-containing protein [Candidatus Mediterraneibacter ornithocaccae]
MSNIQLAANLLRLRTDHDYTQTQIGAKLNISRQAYSNYETGKRIPDLDILIRIADLYHVTLEQLILQPCTGAGVVNENTGPYYIGMEVESADTIYLSKEEVELLSHYRNADEDDRKLTRKVLKM